MPPETLELAVAVSETSMDHIGVEGGLKVVDQQFETARFDLIDLVGHHGPYFFQTDLFVKTEQIDFFPDSQKIVGDFDDVFLLFVLVFVGDVVGEQFRGGHTGKIGRDVGIGRYGNVEPLWAFFECFAIW